MKLFFDEDIGKGVPEALDAVGLKTVTHLRRAFRNQLRRGRFRDGVKDEDWIPFAGQGGWLVFSANTGILEADAQRSLWIEHNVGGVFLTTGQENKVEVLKLVLRRWDWLEGIDAKQPRPFAYRLSMRGRPKLDARVRPLSGP